MDDVLLTIVRISVVVFVVSSMLAMGLSLTVPEIVAPLKKVRFVLLALVANFVVAPFVVILIQAVMDLDDDIYTGLVILATAAGAPFLPKLAQAARGDVAASVGLMVMLMVVTVGYMPLVLPLILSGTTVDPWAIAQSLLFLMLLPLAIGLLVKWRYSDMADGLQPVMSQASSVALLLLLGGGIILQWEGIVSLFGTGGLIAMILFVLACFGAGYLAGGSNPATRSVTSLGTAQRNVSAALVVAGQNFSDTPDVITTVMVGALLGLVILLPLAGEIGKRSGPVEVPASDPST
jgi:BASS family bile acid:Na+ symporter